MATKTGIPAGSATTKAAATLSKEEMMRYSRHLIMPEVGMEGQLKLKQAKVLCIGTGGLGAPLGLYLAAAGVGRIGLVDFDVVDSTNLQRQVLFGTSDVGRPKTEAAADRLRNLNPEIQIDTFETHLTSENALELIQGLRHHRGRHGQFSDALSGERRLRDHWASRMCMARFSASRDRSPYSAIRAALATAASIPNRLRRAWCLRAPKAACSACCRESSARFRRPRRSS